MNKRLYYSALAVLSALVLILMSLWLVRASGVRAAPETRYVASTGSDVGNLCTNPSSPCETIQHAIDVANAGDHIHVANGNYSRVGTLGTITKEVAIIGGFGPPPNFEGPDPDMYETVLDAQGSGSVISMTNAGDVVLQHLTLTHGDGTGSCGSDGCGGGIYARDTVLHVLDCVISDNVGTMAGAGRGGGIYAYNEFGHVDVVGSRVVSNTANADPASSSYAYGGGIYIQHGTASLVENEVLDNVGHVSYHGQGGGIHLSMVTQTELLANTIWGNKASIDSTYGADGGGIWLGYSSGVYLAGNRIENNWTNPYVAGYGGGVEVEDSEAHLNANMIISNSTGIGTGWLRPGGGVSIVSTEPVTLSNNLIAQNDAYYHGGGVFIARFSPPSSRAILVNNTIVDNGETGVKAWYYADVTMTNTLIANHDLGFEEGSPFSGTTSIDTNLFWNTYDFVTGTNAILDDPLLTVDYRPGAGSPAIDAGLTIPWLSVDLEGNSRPNGAGYDIGAFEYYARIFLPLVLKKY